MLIGLCPDSEKNTPGKIGDFRLQRRLFFINMGIGQRTKTICSYNTHKPLVCLIIYLRCHAPLTGQNGIFKSSPSPSTTFTSLNLNDLDDQVQVRLVKGILETKHVSATRNRNRFLPDSIEILVVKNRDSWFHGLWSNKPHNWVGFHPLYTLKPIRAPLFHCSCDHRVSLPVNHVRFLNQNLPACLFKKMLYMSFKKSGPWQDEKNRANFCWDFRESFHHIEGVSLTYKLTVWRL